MSRVNSTAAALLGLLHDGPLSGWDLWSTAQLVIGDFWTVTRSQVYRELAAMAQAGLVVSGETGPRDRKPYALTDAGREATATARVTPAPKRRVGTRRTAGTSDIESAAEKAMRT